MAKNLLFLNGLADQITISLFTQTIVNKFDPHPHLELDLKIHNSIFLQIEENQP